MSDPLNHRTLLEELDHRQDLVLSQLDELNARVELLIREFTGRPESTPVAEGERPDTRPDMAA